MPETNTPAQSAVIAAPAVSEDLNRLINELRRAQDLLNLERSRLMEGVKPASPEREARQTLRRDLAAERLRVAMRGVASTITPLDAVEFAAAVSDETRRVYEWEDGSVTTYFLNLDSEALGVSIMPVAQWNPAENDRTLGTVDTSAMYSLPLAQRLDLFTEYLIRIADLSGARAAHERRPLRCVRCESHTTDRAAGRATCATCPPLA